jgi:hypothetical protein
MDLEPQNARFCAGILPVQSYSFLRCAITGPIAFDQHSGSGFYLADDAAGTLTLHYGLNHDFAIASGYFNGTPIVSRATFNNKSLADLGFTQSTGVVGTWILTDSSDAINVVLGPPPPAAAPGPLPLLGVGAAFGWSRRVRRRMSDRRTTPSQG